MKRTSSLKGIFTECNGLRPALPLTREKLRSFGVDISCWDTLGRQTGKGIATEARSAEI